MLISRRRSGMSEAQYLSSPIALIFGFFNCQFFGGPSRIHSRSIRGLFEICVGSVRCVRGPFGVRSKCVRGLFGIRSGSVCNPFGIRSESVRSPFRVVWSPFGVRTAFVQAPFEVRSGSVRDRSGSVRDPFRPSLPPSNLPHL